MAPSGCMTRRNQQPVTGVAESHSDNTRSKELGKLEEMLEENRLAKEGGFYRPPNDHYTAAPADLNLEEIAGHDSDLHRRCKIYLHRVTVATLPEECSGQCSLRRMLPQFTRFSNRNESQSNQLIQ